VWKGNFNLGRQLKRFGKFYVTANDIWLLKWEKVLNNPQRYVVTLTKLNLIILKLTSWR
jgi:hypothetical protein